MKTYFALTPNNAFIGSFPQCYRHAVNLLSQNEAVQLACARGGEKRARIVGELTTEGFRIIANGRFVNVKSVKKKYARS